MEFEGFFVPKCFCINDLRNGPAPPAIPQVHDYQLLMR